MHVRTSHATTRPHQDHAQRLDTAARMLAEARDREALIGALKANLRTWEALRAALRDAAGEHSLPAALSESERRHIAAMAGHVIATTHAATLPGGRVAPDDSRLESFIALNRHTARTLIRKSLAHKSFARNSLARNSPPGKRLMRERMGKRTPLAPQNITPPASAG